MPKLVPISAKKLIRILKHLGFVELRSRGSHHFFIHPDSKKTATVPVHAGEEVRIGTLKSILNDIDISTEAYEKLRK